MFDMVLNISLDYLGCFAVVPLPYQGDTRDCLIYAKLIIIFTPNLEFSPYPEVIHGSTTFKLTKGWQWLRKNDNYSTWCFWSFFHFLYCSVPDNKCYKQKWGVLYFTCIKLVVRVLACARAIARIIWKRLFHLLQLHRLH